MTIPEQRRQVERLLDAIIPAVFCLEVQPFAVVERERAGHALPHADVVLAAALVARRQSTVKPFAATQLFSEVEALARGKDALATTVQQRLVHLQREFSSDPEFRKAVKQAETGPGKMAVTRTLAVVRALIETLIDDEKRSITTNDALDLLHTAVPLTYCDIILVDGAWFDRAERVRRKLEKGGSSISLGTAFSERKGGVERFLASFEEMR